MDPAAFKLINKCFKLISTRREKLTDSEVSYVIGLLEGALEYSTELEEPAKKPGFFKKMGVE